MKTMCPPGYNHSGFVATHALGYMMYVWWAQSMHDFTVGGHMVCGWLAQSLEISLIYHFEVFWTCSVMPVHLTYLHQLIAFMNIYSHRKNYFPSLEGFLRYCQFIILRCFGQPWACSTTRNWNAWINLLYIQLHSKT